jgi:NAD-dependent deacetylase
MAHMTTETQIDQLTAMVQSARRAIAFTGAGISTECGIPDFRSPDGFWAKYKPIEFDAFVNSAETRLEAWRRYFIIRESLRGAVPGRGHLAISELVRIGKVTHVITQNIDDLHRISGIPANRVIELHGNGTFAKCLSCGQRHELDWVRSEIDKTGQPPTCVQCGGIVKSATISFGQAMPEDELARARAATYDSDLFLALGSSLQVYPAAALPILAKQSGATLVIINRDATELDSMADLVINEDIGTTLTLLIERMQKRISAQTAA